MVAALTDQKKIAQHEDMLALESTMTDMLNRITRELVKIHRDKSYLKGLTAEELARRLGIDDPERFVPVLRYLESRNALGRSMQFYHMPDFSPGLDEEMKAQAGRIMTDVEGAGHNYLSIEEIESRYPGSRRTVNFLVDEGRLKYIGSQFVMTGMIWKEIIDLIEDKLETQGKLTVAEFRDRFGSSRKYALPVLEHLDRVGITRREGDYRIKGANFGERHSL